MNDKITVLGLKSKIETAKKKIPTLKSRQVALKVDQGLYLFVTAASCTWYVRTDSKKKKNRLGTYPGISLSLARQKAEQLQAVWKGTKEEADKIPMLKDFYPKFLDDYGKNNVGKKRFGNLKSFWNILRPLGDLRLDELVPKRVIPVVCSANIGQNYKSNIAQGLKQVLDYAVMLGEIKANPFATISRGKMNPFKREPTAGWPWLPAEQLKENFFGKLELLSEQQKALVLYVTLAAARIGEGVALKWEWIDESAQEIRIPEGIMKTGFAHTVVITSEISEFFKIRKYRHPELLDSEFVFPAWRISVDRSLRSQDLI